MSLHSANHMSWIATYPTPRFAIARISFVVLIALLCVPVTPAVFGQSVLVEEDPDRRKILAILQDLEDITPDNYSQLASFFDAGWALAVRSEDPLLNLSTDREMSLEPGTSQLDAGARYRLKKIFMQSPEAFQEIYRNLVRSDAEAAFEQALKTAELTQLEAVIQRFQFTEVASQGLQHLVQVRRSRGEYLQAALQHGRWMSLNEGGDFRHRVLQVQLWCQAGLIDDAVDELSELLRESSDSEAETLRKAAKILGSAVSVADGSISRSGLRKWLDTVMGEDVRLANRPTAAEEADVASKASSINYLQPLGNSRRTQTNRALLTGDLQTAWQQSTFTCLEAFEVNPALQGLARELQAMVSTAFAANQTVAPIATPIAVGNRLIFRCAMNLRAVDLQTGEPLWESFLLDRHLRSVLERRAQSQPSGSRSSGGSPGGETWDLLNFDPQSPRFLYSGLSRGWNPLGTHWIQTNTAGQLTSDGRTVFAVEEVMSETLRNSAARQIEVSQVHSNYLRAYDVETGRLRAQAGGNVGNSGESGVVNPLAGMYFLGAPLVLGDRIYVIAEAEPGIYLLQLKATPLYGPADEFQLQPVFSQLLSIPRFPLRLHPVRSQAGIVPSYGRGLIICSTCDEHIIAVSAEDHSVRWIYRYPTIVSMAELGPRQGLLSGALDSDESSGFDRKARWTDCLPRIVGNRIIVTPRDSDELLCLNLQTGEEIWTMPRGDFRTVATVDVDKVVVTGAKAITAFALSDGSELWSTELRDGRICGSGFSDGSTLQLPTSRPGILAVRLADGQQLLHQSTRQLPGNLFSNGDVLVSQNVTDVQSLAAGDSDNTSFVAARSELLRGNLLPATDLLKAAIQEAKTVQRKRRAQDQFVDAVVSAVRAGNQEVIQLIPDAEAMLVELRSRDDVLGLLLAQGIGIPPISPDVLRFAELQRADSQWAELQELITLQSLQDQSGPPDLVADRMFKLLQQAWEQQGDVVSNSLLIARKERVVFQQIRSAIDERDEQIQLQVKERLAELLEEQFRTRMKAEETRWWLNACLMIDITGPAAKVLNTDEGPLLKSVSNAMQDLVCRRYVESSLSPAAAQQLMDRMEADGQLSSLVDLLLTTEDHRRWQDEFVIDQDRNGLLAEGWFSKDLVSNEDLDERLARLLEQQADSHWAGKPTVIESDAHSVRGPPAMDIIGSVTQDLPVFDSNNQYRHWNFNVQSNRERGPLSFELKAYDAQGQFRWSHPLETQLRRRFFSAKHPTLLNYVVGYGQLVLVRRPTELTMLDCSKATPQSAPRVLWTKELSGSRALRTSSWERTTVYDRQPTGLAPAGPISRFGLPIVLGADLVVVDPVTGQEQWQVTGLAEDCSLTIREDRLYVMSQSASQIEIRSLIDGTILGTRAIPDWWRDAEENSTTTPRYYELDDNDSLPFRIQICGGNCVLYRHGLKEVTIESFDLDSSTVNWSRKFPGESPVSNVCGGVVAVLSNGNRLQLVDITSGAVHEAVDVPIASPDVQYLYLRRSGGQWVVITDQFETDHDENNTVNQAVIVNGAVHGLSVVDGSLSWSQPIKYQWVRIRRPGSMQPAIPPVAPFLVLLSRPNPEVNELGQRRGRLVYHTQILDVRTGEELYQDNDMGYTLSNFYMKLQPEEDRVVLNFDKRSLTFDYSESEQPPLPKESDPEPR